MTDIVCADCGFELNDVETNACCTKCNYRQERMVDVLKVQIANQSHYIECLLTEIKQLKENK